MNKAQAQTTMEAWHDDTHVDRRKLCRAENILIEKPGLYKAYCRGVWDAYRAPRSNPYPPGRRHEEWQKNYNRVLADLQSGNRNRPVVGENGN